MKGATTKTLKIFSAILCGIALAATVWTVMRRNAPPLNIVRDHARVIVDVSTLGEYPTTITRIRLSDSNSGSLVWELNAANGTAQIHGFTLAEGENPIQIDTDYGTYRTVMPSDSTTFVLRRGRVYRLEMWGGDRIFTKRSFSFSVANAR